jgi:monoamine oxidase
LRGIEFDPPLPAATASLVDGWQQAYGCKSFAVYATPWWRANGLSGLATGDLAVRSVIDLSPHDGSLGILLAETHPSSDPAANPDDAEQRELVLDGIARYLGEPAEPLLHFGSYSWPVDPWAGGCGSPLAPGLISAFGSALGRPVGAIHFAGTESSDVGWGSMEGAVRAGQRAAAELIALRG